MSLSEIEIEHQCYCEENGYFCRYLDKKSGFCIATSCKHAQELLEQAEIEKRAKAVKEAEDGRSAVNEHLLERALEQLENFGASTIELNISEDDLNDLERNWKNVRIPAEED